MSAVDMFVCLQCGSETPAGRCRRCGVDPDASFLKGKMPRAHDVKPRRITRLNRALPYTDRPAEIVRLLERGGVDLASSKLLIDVGCGPNLMRGAVAGRYPKLTVLGYDQYTFDGAGDVRTIDLEHAVLPYGDGEVDVAVCSHVLEHVDNTHALTDEMCRVAKNVIILLPNSVLWTTLAKVALQRSLLPMIGLPLEKPMDRHRWIYTVGEATRWMRHVAGKWNRNLDIVYRTDWRLPTFFGRLGRDLFVLEMSYLLSPREGG